MEEKLESSPILCRTSSAEEIDALAEELPLPLPLPFERDIENAESNHQESEGDINVSLDSSRGQEDKETPRASPTALAEVESAVAEAELEALESSSPPAGSLPRNVFLSKKERKALPFRRSTFKSQGGYFAKVQRRNRPKREDSLSQSDGSHRQRFLNEVRQQSGLSLEDESSADDIMNNQIIYDDDLTLEDENTSDGKPHATATTPLHRQQRHKKSSSTSTLDHKNQMSMDDIEICQRLDEEYERALEEREIGYNARYGSVRQSAFLSVFFMFTFLCLGTLFFMRQTAWTVPDALLFSIYTITTVGYGNVSGAPTTPGFQAYTIFYILVGVAALTIMVAQVYQCIALEASRAQHSRDKNEMARRGLDILTSSQEENTARGNIHGDASADEIIAYHQDNMPGIIDQAFRCFDHAKNFFRNNEVGRGISVIFPFAGLILIGAAVVGPIEGWTVLEAFYFSVVSLTTVGFGDYVPTNRASIWFCIFWLPFSIGFMSMFLGNVAAFYIRLSDRNIRRIERQMRRRLQRAKDKAELERAEVLRRAYRGQEVEIEAASAQIPEGQNPPAQVEVPNLSEMAASHIIPPHHAQSIARRRNNRGFDALPITDGHNEEVESETHSLFESNRSDAGSKRRQQIMENSCVSSQGSSSRPNGRTMQSMRDVVRAVRNNLNSSDSESDAAVIRTGPDVKFMSIHSTQPMVSHSILRRVQTRKPSFALRVLVQERFAEIIATDIAGFQSSIAIKDDTLSVTIESLKDMADKWLVPRRARKAFRAVAFEVLYFVGEHGLITRGADALYDLSPFEFHGLFSPLVAAMGDADTMEGWLASTDILADVDLRLHQQQSLQSNQGDTKLTLEQQEKIAKRPSRATVQETVSDRPIRLTPGNALTL